MCLWWYNKGGYCMVDFCWVCFFPKKRKVVTKSAALVKLFEKQPSLSAIDRSTFTLVPKPLQQPQTALHCWHSNSFFIIYIVNNPSLPKFLSSLIERILANTDCPPYQISQIQLYHKISTFHLSNNSPNQTFQTKSQFILQCYTKISPFDNNPHHYRNF